MGFSLKHITELILSLLAMSDKLLNRTEPMKEPALVTMHSGMVKFHEQCILQSGNSAKKKVYDRKKANVANC